MRICKKCQQKIEPGKPDPCLGYLPGIAQACCGHGDEQFGENWQAYCCGWPGCNPHDDAMSMRLEQLSDAEGYWVLRGNQALEYMNEIKD